jgi:O-antigen/teichoic acid export membrane protein
MANRTVPTERIVRSLSALSIMLTALGCALFFLTARVLEGSVVARGASVILLLSAATIPPAIVAQMASGILLRSDRLASFVRIGALGAMAQAVTVIVLDLAVGLTPELAAAALVVSGLVTAAGVTVAVGRTLGWGVLRPAVDMSVLRPLLSVAVRLHPATLAFFLTMRLDLLIMAALTGDTQVGLYSLAVTLGELVLFAAVALSQAATHHQTHETEAVAADFTVGFVRQSWPIVAGFVLLLTITAWPGVVLIYGAEWEPAVPALIILSWAVAALAVTGSLPIYLIRSVDPIKLARTAGIALVANVILVLLLVPPLGATGAALASLVAYWLYAARLIQLMHRQSGVGLRAMLGRPQPGDPILRMVRRLLR